MYYLCQVSARGMKLPTLLIKKRPDCGVDPPSSKNAGQSDDEGVLCVGLPSQNVEEPALSHNLHGW